VGTPLLIIPMMGLGIEGMRRRVADYDLTMGFQTLHILTAVGGFLIFAGLVVFVFNVVRSLKGGAIAGNNPWGGRTLEWQTTSPPPEDNFAEIPLVLDRPHLHGVEGSVHAVTEPSSSMDKEYDGS
jgi:heme/copper-type cytochrome/quinol oxidase subunit 1